jgi:nucleoside-diphosphate-sugar epimerase
MKSINQSRTVLITGGTGFVCMNIAETLLEDGIDVVAMARHELKEQAFEELSTKKGRFSFCRGDVLDEASMTDIIAQYGVTDVVHGAAITPSREMEIEYPKEVLEVNCIGLMSALNASKATNVGRFIYLGSVSGYGETCFNSEVLVEGQSLGNPHTLYEISKFTGERIVQRYRDLFKMDAIVARVGDVFGTWERKTGVRSYMSLPYQLTSAARSRAHVILPKPNCIDWVYGKDVGRAVHALLCADTLHYDVYPLCSGYLWPLTAWCEHLEVQFPGFRWRMAEEGEISTIKVNQIEDNAPMQLDRLIEDTGFKPYFDLKRAFRDYMAWIDSHPGYLT